MARKTPNAAATDAAPSNPTCDDEPMVDTNVLVDSKKEYVDQLERGFLNPAFDALKNVLTDAMNVARDQEMDAMDCFVRLLEEIPTWNQDIIEEETKQVSQTMPYLKELLKAYFVCTSMILASIRMSKNKNDKMKVKVPAPERFVHMVLKGVALDVVDDLDHFVDALEDGTFKLKRRAVLKSVSESVKNALHRLMPIDDILKEYMGDILSKDSFKSGGAASCADGGGGGSSRGVTTEGEGEVDVDADEVTKSVKLSKRKSAVSGGSGGGGQRDRGVSGDAGDLDDYLDADDGRGDDVEDEIEDEEF
eukprot:jgi/Mesvir1/13550/Mv06362-RA.1